MIGAGLIAVGILVVTIPIMGVLNRNSNAQNALYNWDHGGSTSIQGAVKGAPTQAAPSNLCSAQNAPASDYALITFPTVNGITYAGVAAQGTWAQLLTTTMVHYDTTPAPGQAGNVIIGFHREPQYEYINQMKVGQDIIIETRDCATFTYQITGTWVETPAQVTQLVSTSGHNLTLITCTPWWIDTSRIVWRGTLVSSTPPTTTTPAPQPSASPTH